MVLRPVWRTIPSGDVCIFCALRPPLRIKNLRTRFTPQFRPYGSTAASRQAAQAAAVKVDEARGEDEENNDYHVPPMLRHNAAVQRGINFPEHQRPPPASPALDPRSQPFPSISPADWRCQLGHLNRSHIQRCGVCAKRRPSGPGQVSQPPTRSRESVANASEPAITNSHYERRHLRRDHQGHDLGRSLDTEVNYISRFKLGSDTIARKSRYTGRQRLSCVDQDQVRDSRTSSHGERPMRDRPALASQTADAPPTTLYQPLSGRPTANPSHTESLRTSKIATASTRVDTIETNFQGTNARHDTVRHFVPYSTSSSDDLEEPENFAVRGPFQRPGNTDSTETVLPTASSPEFSAYSEGVRKSHARSSRLERMSSRFDVNVAETSSDQPSTSTRKKQGRSGRARLTETDDEHDGPDNDDILEAATRKKSKRKVKAARSDSALRPEVQLPEFISVEKLAQSLKVRVDDLVRKLEQEGFEGARYDHILDAETSGMFADIYGFEPVFGASSVQDLVACPPSEDKSVLSQRAPIVTIMGHVDHGKTTILDWLRKSSVVESEHGGITQHIGAFQFRMPGSERQITFLDTPGHAAFLDMRRRGALVTDIVVLVVAADDSVKPQTLEAIKHALEAQVQIIVAINKVDKADANIERVKQDLAQHEISVEDYGGEYQAIAVSGKTGQGMQDLEEAILTLADVSDFRAETEGQAEGWVIESKVTSAGRVATVLVRRGTLRPSDIIVAGTTWARVRTLKNDAGQIVTEAPPGTPVQIDGWRGDPVAGLEVIQADSEDQAKDVVDMRLQREESMETAADMAAINAARSADANARARVLEKEAEDRATFMATRNSKRHWVRPIENEGFLERGNEGAQNVTFVIKADVAGSVEAVTAVVKAVGNDEISANVIHCAAGQITESDIRRVAATGEKGYVINFNQAIDPQMVRLAEVAGLEILDHNIIYKVTDDVKRRLGEALPPIRSQRVLGEAEVGQVFEVTTKKGKHRVAGCKVTNGTVDRTHKIRVLRAGDTIYQGGLESLKNVKKDVTEMRKGSECGMAFANWTSFEAGDKIQCFEEKEEKRILY